MHSSNLKRPRKPAIYRRLENGNSPTSFGGLTRSELMSRIRKQGNKSTETRMVKLLRSHGLIGWRRHLPIPGHPDFAWPKHRLALFVDGCFWHSHDCKRFFPRTHIKYWKNKLVGNAARDRSITRTLRSGGWCVLRVWECNLKNKSRIVAHRIEQHLMQSNPKADGYS